MSGRVERAGPGPIGALQQAGDPVKPHPQQIQTDRHQGLPEAPDQPLGVAGVDPGDGGRVVAEQASRFDEVAQLGFVA